MWLWTTARTDSGTLIDCGRCCLRALRCVCAGGGKPSVPRAVVSCACRSVFLLSPSFSYTNSPIPPTHPLFARQPQQHPNCATAPPPPPSFPTGVVESNSQFRVRNASNPTQWVTAIQNYVLVPNGKCFLGSHGQSKASGIGKQNYTGTKTVETGNFTACKMACSREDCRCA